jgi:GTP1/Obg family GTP-binding protein
MRSLARCLLWLLPLALVGCATDPREALIKSALAYVDQAATEIGTIKDRVNEAYKKRDNKKLDTKELKEAYGSIDSLKKLSKEMQLVKQRIETVAGSTSEDQRQALAKDYQGKLSTALARIHEERSGLEKAIVQAEELDPDAVKELRSKLTEAEGSFVMLARQR